MREHVAIEFAALFFIRARQDLGDSCVDFMLVRETELSLIVAVDTLTHCGERRLRIIGRSPADIEDHVELAVLHVVAIGLFFFAAD